MQIVEFSVGTLFLVGFVAGTLGVGGYVLYSMAREEGKEITPGLKVGFPVPDLPDLPDLFDLFSRLRLPERVG